LRGDEDWSWLRDVPQEDRRALDRLKYLPLNTDGSIFLTFSFDGIAGLEYFDNESFGDNPGDDVSWHFQANPHLGLTVGERFRLYGALKFGDVVDERFPVLTFEDDGPDIHQAFAELSFGDAFGLDTKDMFVRVGRQELHYGGGRLISIRKGVNVRQDFDAVLARGRFGSTVGDVFYARPVQDENGAFNNSRDDSQLVWGLYTSTALGQALPSAGEFLGRSHLDLFYMGFERDASIYTFQPAPLGEERHTVGARFWTGGAPSDGFNLEVVAAYQFGEVDGLIVDGASRDADISAGFAAGVISYGFSEAPWSPIAELRLGYSSGDDAPFDDTLTSFRAPFPPGRYFGESNPLGPGNIAGLGPAIIVSPLDALTVTARYEAFWRVSDEEGIHFPSQVPLRGSTGDDRFVGQEIALIADYALNDALTVNFTAAVFDAGGFLEDNPPGEDIGYAQLKLIASF
jgi:hypothetical protein